MVESSTEKDISQKASWKTPDGLKDSAAPEEIDICTDISVLF